MKKGVFKRKSTSQEVATESDSLSRSQLFNVQFQALFTKFKPFLGTEFWPWFETFELPNEVCEVLDEAGAGVLYLHAFVFHLSWQPAEESWEIQWRVDESKLSPDYPLDRELAREIQLKRVDQVMVDKKHRRVCQTYHDQVFTRVW